MSVFVENNTIPSVDPVSRVIPVMGTRTGTVFGGEGKQERTIHVNDSVYTEKLTVKILVSYWIHYGLMF